MEPPQVQGARPRAGASPRSWITEGRVLVVIGVAAALLWARNTATVLLSSETPHVEALLVAVSLALAGTAVGSVAGYLGHSRLTAPEAGAPYMSVMLVLQGLMLLAIGVWPALGGTPSVPDWILLGCASSVAGMSVGVAMVRGYGPR